jgi:hypothetical protein
VVALGLGLLSAELRAQVKVTITDIGPGPSGRILEEVLKRPHRLIEPDSGWFVLGRNAQEQTSLVVLGRTAAIAGLVEGDVVVVGGDLFVRPGARISGRAVAIGGGVYPSSIAYIGKGTESFRDNTFSITREAGGYRLAYQSLRENPSRPLLFPALYGLRFLSYDRVNGASIPFGPALSFAGGRGEVDVLATYRTDIGKIDPSVVGTLELTRRSRFEVSVQRGTFSNDKWIWSNFVNSLSALAYGADTRNYYRADRADLTVHRRWEWAHIQLEPFVGGLTEKAWSVGPGVGERRGPWSIFNRTDTTTGMWRPNPLIEPGAVTSGLAGSAIRWDSEQLRLNARSRAEMSFSAPSDQQFTQVTSDLDVGFPTFGEQSYALDVHWVTTVGDTPPPQRFAYIGGLGTLLFIDLLTQGGDELLLIDQRYSVPLLGMRLGFLGNPTLIFRHRIGSAGLNHLPSFDQMIGAGVGLMIIRAELWFDPIRKRTKAGIGLTFSR